MNKIVVLIIQWIIVLIAIADIYLYFDNIYLVIVFSSISGYLICFVLFSTSKYVEELKNVDKI